MPSKVKVLRFGTKTIPLEVNVLVTITQRSDETIADIATSTVLHDDCAFQQIRVNIGATDRETLWR
jgi:hypothetical protein